MSFLSPRIAPGIGTAMARVAERFYFFTILLVGATIYLPHEALSRPLYLYLLALVSVGMIIFLRFFPWDRYEPRVFTLAHLISSSLLLTMLVYFTGGIKSSYDLLFFLVILFSYFYNLPEMFFITTVVSVFYLTPYVYGRPRMNDIAVSAVTVLFFYLGTYILYGVTRFVLKKNRLLEDLNKDLEELYSITDDILKDVEKDAVIERMSESLKDHLPSTYCIVMVLDDKMNLTTRIACPVRTMNWEPEIGVVYSHAQLPRLREVLEARQPKVFKIDNDDLDPELSRIITARTRSALAVPIRVAAENVGMIIFGEERQWERSPFNNEKIQLAVAISRQVAVGLNMWWCYQRLEEAQHNLQVSHDKVIKAERLAALGEVTRAVEHEVNNPLNVIVNWSEIYRDDKNIDQEMRKKFQIIYDMAMRIRDVVRKLGEIKDIKSIEFIKGQKMTDIEKP